VVELDRIKTGIPGLDDLVDGGFPKGNLIVVSGDPGSGKTILCMEYLYYGAEKYDEPGVYVSLEESKEGVIKLASLFGWDFEELIKKKKLDIVAVDLYDFEQLKDIIEDSVSRIKAKRIVIDPGVIFRLYFKNELDARKQLLGLGKMLKKTNCTAVVTNELLDKESTLFGLEEYVADGVVLLFHKKVNEHFLRSIAVLKMRGTKISEKVFPVSLSKKGIIILSKQEVFD